MSATTKLACLCRPKRERSTCEAGRTTCDRCFRAWTCISPSSSSRRRSNLSPKCLRCAVASTCRRDNCHPVPAPPAPRHGRPPAFPVNRSGPVRSRRSAVTARPVRSAVPRPPPITKPPASAVRPRFPSRRAWTACPTRIRAGCRTAPVPLHPACWCKVTQYVYWVPSRLWTPSAPLSCNFCRLRDDFDDDGSWWSIRCDRI